jgi:hypothetical protein
MNSYPVLLWFCSAVCVRYALPQFKPLLAVILSSAGTRKKIADLKYNIRIFNALIDWIASGLIPEPEDWKRLQSLSTPWNSIATESLAELRDQGAPVLPTLKRLKLASEEQVDLILESQTKSAQAWTQAILGLILVPIFAAVIYAILPGVQEQAGLFFAASIVAILFTLGSVVWIAVLVNDASFGSVELKYRTWYGNTIATLERLMAKISTGVPADLAWRFTVETLSKSQPELALRWGLQIWEEVPLIPASQDKTITNDRLILVLRLGMDLRRAIQVSLVEGQGCLERLEGIQRAFWVEYRLKMQRDLNLLPNRCLQPLFLGLLPAVFILLGSGLMISISETANGMN